MSDTIEVDELAGRLGSDDLTILDVRTEVEFSGQAGYPCDPCQGHIPGARNLDLAFIVQLTPDELRQTIDLPAGAEIATYCHSGARSAHAAELLRGAGYRARNYVGSWHEWSRREDAQAEA